MKKPQLCLALSISIALLQANLLQANAETSSQAIWQKLAGVNANSTGGRKPVAKKAASCVVRRAAPAVTASGVAASAANNGQIALFLGKDKSAAKDPAAALTIHSSLPLTESNDTVATAAQSQLIAMSEAVASDTTAEVEPAAAAEAEAAPSIPVPSLTSIAPKETAKYSSKQLLAQLAPDQLIAQADANATPIPPVVSGTVDLEEFKPSNTIDLKVSQSRTFKLRNKIIRTSISDPSIAEPVVVAENQMVLLGKAPGGSTLVIWDDAGNSVAIDVRVSRDFSALQSIIREIDPRIIVRTFSVGGSDRIIMMGDVDHPESVIRAFAAANAFMDDRGMNVVVSGSRIMDKRLGEQGGTSSGGQQSGQLSTIGQTDRYTFFGNQNNNISRAQSIVSDGGRVTSLVRIRKAPLIVLHCTFMEMNSVAVRELGVQLGVAFTSNTFTFGIGGNNVTGLGGAGGPSVPFSIGQVGPTLQPGVPSPVTLGTFNTVNVGTAQLPTSGLGQGLLNTSPAALLAGTTLFGIPGGANFTTASLANLFTGISNFVGNRNSRWSVSPTLQGIITHSRARVLSEPTLVTISGERAAFLAGGEIPILQSIATAGTAAQSVVFEPFGMRLNMVPVLLETGTINLQVSPEERLLDRSNALNLFGGGTTAIPAFVTRRTQTTVELKPGQELFISGLVSSNHGRELNKTPILGEVPVLGALYRSKAFSKNESELVVAVRPEVILPGTPGQLKLPEEISKVEGPRDTNILQVEPTVLDERYMRTGRSERTLALPGTLPADAPIPDNK
jgi:Flp pilus assembly secretin CpaC